GRIVPAGDLAEEDAGKGLAAESQVGANLGKVVDRNHGAQDRGEMQHAAGGGQQLIGGQGSVGGAKEHLLVGEVAVPPPRADRLIVDLKVGMQLVVLGKPLG